MGFAYQSDTRWADQYFAKGVTVPSATNSLSNALKVGSHQGSLMLKVAAGETAIALTAAKTLKLEIYECDTESGTYVAHEGAPSLLFTGAASTGTTFAANSALAALILPNCKKYVKIKMTTDAATTGTLDIYLDYVAR